MNYQSSARLLGLPLIHIARGVARGWIAIGDVAVGLIAIGGLAIGGFAVGGASVGLVSIAGLAIGAASIGGISAGLLAVGGLALGLWAAVGGLAVAKDFAIGGVAVAQHVNDTTATHYVDTQIFFRAASWVNFHAITLAFLPMMVVFLLVIVKILRGSTHRDIT